MMSTKILSILSTYIVGISIVMSGCSYDKSTDKITINTEETIKHYNEVITSNPMNADAYYQRGLAKLSISDYQKDKIEDVIIDLTKAIKINSQLKDVYYERAGAYRILEQEDKAVSDYNKVIEIDPRYINAYFKKVSLLSLETHKDEILTYYDKILEADPNNAESYYRKGILYQYVGTTGEQEKAIINYNKAIEIEPLYINAYSERGSIYEKLGDYTGAIIDYTTVIELANHSGAIQYEYGNKFFLEKNAYTASAYMTRGLLQQRLGNHEKAIIDFSEAINSDALFNNISAHYYDLRGQSYRQLGKDDLALQDYNKAIEVLPHFATAYKYRGELYKHLCNTHAAIEDLTKACNLNTKFCSKNNR